jgi:biopolymer transport protein ExbD
MAASFGAEDGDAGFQIAPMVDLVFVLLLFFIASAGARLVEKELTITLPSRSPEAWTGPGPIVIEISSEGEVTMNGQKMGAPADCDLAQLKTWLKSNLGDGDGTDPVIIRPSPASRQERVIDVLNACAAGKVRNVTFS